MPPISLMKPIFRNLVYKLHVTTVSEIAQRQIYMYTIVNKPGVSDKFSTKMTDKRRKSYKSIVALPFF